MIKRKISILAFLVSGIMFSGCGGTKCLIKDCSSLEMSDQIIEIQQGEQKEILKHKSGIIWGGYAPGFRLKLSPLIMI